MEHSYEIEKKSRKIMKKIFCFFFEKHFDLEKNYFFSDFFLYQSKKIPGIQKSYLQKRATNLKVRTKKIRTFLHCVPDFGHVLRITTLKVNGSAGMKRQIP